MSGNANSTVKDGGLFYSENKENSSISYNIMPSIVNGYIIKSYKGDVYPKSWDLQSSNDGVNWEVLDTSTTPLCAKFKENVEEVWQRCQG